MKTLNSIFLSDSYKMAHPAMLPEGCTLLYGNCTPRSNKHAPKNISKVLSFGQQLTVRWIKNHFDENFFNIPDVVEQIEEELSLHYGAPYDGSHFRKLHKLGYLPLKFKSIEEGILVPFGVPTMTWYNTHPDFAWLPLCLETPLSTIYWKLPTSATIALQYKKVLKKWCLKTDKSNLDFVNFQGHDFSARGMSGIEATWLSGLGHLTSFLGSDTLSCIPAAREYYDEEGFVSASVPASEHSVSSACISTMGEKEMIKYYMKKFPKGFLSIVSDTFNLWKVLTEYLPQLKEEILERDGKIVIRPDSGNPVDIICGVNGSQYPELKDNIMSSREMYDKYWDGDSSYEEFAGVIQLLWDTFGGTINEQGYKVLDPHIGAIYGDSITIDRAEEICKRLEAKGFASTNIVLGIGSFTYQYNTRDTFGFAMKATYVEIKHKLESGSGAYGVEGREIFKDPITDDGTKKSAKGLLQVYNCKKCNKIKLKDQVSWEQEEQGLLQTIFENGEFKNQTTLSEIRNKLNQI